MNQYEDQGISLADIWEKLWKHKFLIIIITASSAIILGIGSFYFMKGSQTTKTNFEYNFIGVTENAYPDGSLFEFRDLISYDVLLEVKASSALFNDVDIESMYLDRQTSISRQLSVYSTATDIDYSDHRYELSIPFSYFGYDKDIAELFITSLIETVIDEAQLKNDELKIFNYIDFIDQDVEYLDMVGYYSNQYNLIINSMNTFMSTYGNVTFNGINLSEMKELMQFQYNNGYSFSELTTIIKVNNYFKNSDIYVDRLNVRIDALLEFIDLNTLKIAELETTYTNLVSTSNLEQANQILSDIVDYRIENVEYQYQIDQYQEIIDAANLSGLTSNATPEFLAIIDDVESLINDYTDQYSTFYLAYINDQTRVVYDTGSIYEIEGGYSLIMTTFVSGFIGLMVSFVVVFIIESEKQKKALTKA